MNTELARLRSRDINDASYISPPRTPMTSSPIGEDDVGTDVGSASDVNSQSRSEDVEDPEELELLNNADIDAGCSTKHELLTAPLFTRAAYLRSCQLSGQEDGQYGVLGHVLGVHSREDSEVPQDKRLYVNTNAPFSAIVCGVQGSGKSHTVSVLLENMFVQDYPKIGKLSKSLSGLVLHFGEGGAAAKPCEAAWLGVSAASAVQVPRITVFVSASSLKTMRGVYAPLGKNITVHPLYFAESELDAESFKAMMGIGITDASPPLYIQIILSILRGLGEDFSYRAFERQLEDQKQKFNPMQLSGLEQRMWLLKSFMKKTDFRGARINGEATPRFAAGQLTIVDLSDPFIDATSACGLFEIITRLFVRADVGTGKVLVVDEAHKYLCQQQGSSALTERLSKLVRQQRHLGMRIIISTQEPTVVPPVLLDLCSVALVHRFSSPSWWDHLRKHVSANLSEEQGFDTVVGLQTGEAVVLAPSALVMKKDAAASDDVGQLGRCYMVVKTRRRVTADGGASILVV